MTVRYRIGFIVASFAAIAFASSGCAGKAADPASRASLNGGIMHEKKAIIQVQSMAAKIDLLSTDRSTAGVIVPVTQSQVAAQVAGVVSKVPHLVGDWVKAGETVMQLDDSQLRLTLATAEAALENAKINLSVGRDNSADANPKLSLQLQSAQSALDSARKNFEAQKALYDLGGISASQLDTANSQLSAAQANLEGAKSALSQNSKSDDQSTAQLKLAVTVAQNQVDQARLNLRNASIRAPFAGQIAAINLQSGMYANLNTAAFTLVSAARHIAFNVSPSDASFLKSGFPVTFSYQGSESSSRVSQEPSAPISGVIPLFASVPPAMSGLSYGSVGTVKYRVPLARGALIPLSSLQTIESRNFVYVIESGAVAVKNVTVTAEAGTTAAVEGLGPGDVVIVSPPPGLIVGAEVESKADAQ